MGVSGSMGGVLASVGGAMKTAGSNLKSNLPAPVAKTLPNTGGGWTVLGVAGAALIGGGMLLVRRFSR
jgi:LPXTG-motif cell wall-anchored protein